MKKQEKKSKTLRIRLLPQLYIIKHCVYIFVLHNLYLERYLQAVTEYRIIFLNWSNILFRNIIYIFLLFSNGIIMLLHLFGRILFHSFLVNGYPEDTTYQGKY